MKGLVDKLLALGQETAPANENYVDHSLARPNSTRLLGMLDDYLDASSLAEELINWMPDGEVGRFAKENGYFPDEGGEELDAEEGAESRSMRLIDDIDEFNSRVMKAYGELKEVLGRNPSLSDILERLQEEYDDYEDVDQDPRSYVSYLNAIDSTLTEAGLEVDKSNQSEAEESLTEKEEETLDELPPEQPIGDSQALDEEQGKPVKSATEKKSVYEEYDEMEKEMFEAMNRNSITDFQASVSDSISRIGSLGTIQLLLDSNLADSFEDELFFIKNTYDLSDTQLVSQAILDAGETLLEDGELERAIETLKNSSEEENEEEFGEYEEPEDWSEVDQVEEETVEEPAEGEPAEGEEITEEETEFEEENI